MYISHCFFNISQIIHVHALAIIFSFLQSLFEHAKLIESCGKSKYSLPYSTHYSGEYIYFITVFRNTLYRNNIYTAMRTVQK